MAKNPIGQRCENCRYSEDLKGRGDAPLCCVRFPPMRLHDDNNTGFWPGTEKDYWCGEWAPANPETITEGAATLARLTLLGDLTAARALADKLREE